MTLYLDENQVRAHLTMADLIPAMEKALVDFSAERGTGLNLGGGITPGDRLEEFKRGFGNREVQWYSQELVCDPEAYRELTGDREGSDFFPAYRAPSADAEDQ